jgi:hypothetical protein
VHADPATNMRDSRLDAQRSCAWAGRCSPEAHSPDRTAKLAFSLFRTLSVSGASLVPPAADNMGP